LKEFIDCPVCGSRMRWDSDDNEYSCGACASILSVPVAAQLQDNGNGQMAEICDWKVESDTYYHTSCGEIVQSILDIAGMKFCPYCSRKLRPC